MTPYGTWVACRFEDVNRACADLNPDRQLRGGCNPYSGKWNLHFDAVAMKVADRLIQLKQHLSRVMDAPNAGVDHD